MPSNIPEPSTGGDPYLLTADQLAQRLGLSVPTIKWLVTSKKIPKVRLGHRTLMFRLESVKQAIKKLEEV